MNYYEILGINEDADKKSIQEAFRSLSKKLHPDITKEHNDRYIEIIEAYKTLVNENAKKLYDQMLKKEAEERLVRIKAKPNILPYNRIEYSKSLINLLSMNFDKLKKAIRWESSDCNIEISVTPLEIKMGASAIIDIPGRIVCPYCKGSNPSCYFCGGYGYVKKTEKILISIPHSIKDQEIFEINLKEYKNPHTQILFKSKCLKVKIKLIQ